MSEIQTEQIVTMPIHNPATGRSSRTFRFKGKVDQVEGHVLADWKAVGNPQRFIDQRAVGFQAELYAMALDHAGHRIDEMQYRLVTIPSIRLCAKDKSADDYQQRCLEWLTDKSEHMVNYSMLINSGRCLQAQRHLWNCTQRIRECRKHDRWLPSESGCFMWNRRCAFFPLCAAVAEDNAIDDLLTIDFEVIDDPHPELGGQNDRTLTYSAISCLTLCELKYYWKYECSLRVKHDYAESRWLGSAMHCALEAYVTGGLDAAMVAVDEWKNANPILGPDADHQQQQQIARAKAMTQAAAMKWGLAEQS